MVLVQHGIDHARRLEGLVPPEQVPPSIAYISSECTGPGQVIHRFGNRLVTPAGKLGDRLRDVGWLGPERRDRARLPHGELAEAPR